MDFVEDDVADHGDEAEHSTGNPQPVGVTLSSSQPAK